MRDIHWDFSADGHMRIFNERGEVVAWLDPKQAERLGRDIRRLVPNEDEPEYVPLPSWSNHGRIERMP